MMIYEVCLFGLPPQPTLPLHSLPFGFRRIDDPVGPGGRGRCGRSEEGRMMASMAHWACQMRPVSWILMAPAFHSSQMPCIKVKPRFHGADSMEAVKKEWIDP